MRRVRIAAAVLLAAGLAACGADRETGGPPDLSGEWQLVSGTHMGTDLDPLDSHPITLVIDDDQAGGTAACNGYGGNVSVDGDTVRFSELAITEMACFPAAVMDLERSYMDALLLVDTAEIEGETLELTGPDVRLVFEAVAPVSGADLLGTVWVLDGLVSGDAVTSTTGERATLELFSDGSFLASTGCRSVSGTYTYQAGRVETTALRAEGACPDQLSAQDAHVLSVLESGYQVDLMGDRLSITDKGTMGLTYTADR